MAVTAVVPPEGEALPPRPEPELYLTLEARVSGSAEQETLITARQPREPLAPPEDVDPKAKGGKDKGKDKGGCGVWCGCGGSLPSAGLC